MRRGDSVYNIEANIVPRGLVLSADIAEANNDKANALSHLRTISNLSLTVSHRDGSRLRGRF